MRRLLVYDSQFGNTAHIAQALAAALEAGGTVRLVNAREASMLDPTEAELEINESCPDVDLLPRAWFTRLIAVLGGLLSERQRLFTLGSPASTRHVSRLSEAKGAQMIATPPTSPREGVDGRREFATRAAAMERPRRVAWLIIAIADAGLLVWGAMAAMAPDILRIGYESFTGRSWPELANTSPMTPEFIMLLFRLLGAYNLAFGVLALAIAAVAFRHGDAWAWWALLIGNTIAFGAPMTYDQIVGAIGPFEVLEYVAIIGIYMALAVTAPFRAAGRRS